ncbi:UNVERIFIED_CONTAM: hypothetical protein K2H54_048691 [Gekko kuhli]
MVDCRVSSPGGAKQDNWAQNRKGGEGRASPTGAVTALPAMGTVWGQKRLIQDGGRQPPPASLTAAILSPPPRLFRSDSGLAPSFPPPGPGLCPRPPHISSAPCPVLEVKQQVPRPSRGPYGPLLQDAALARPSCGLLRACIVAGAEAWFCVGVKA